MDGFLFITPYESYREGRCRRRAYATLHCPSRSSIYAGEGFVRRFVVNHTSTIPLVILWTDVSRDGLCISAVQNLVGFAT